MAKTGKLHATRSVWKVIDRIFNPTDHRDRIALVVEQRASTEADTWVPEKGPQRP